MGTNRPCDTPAGSHPRQRKVCKPEVNVNVFHVMAVGPEALRSVSYQPGICGPGMLDCSPSKHLDSNEPMQSAAEVDGLSAIIS